MTDCLFCKIITGDVPAEKVYEDEHVYAFLDINPVNPGHTLVSPKKHVVNLYDMSDELLSNIAPAVKKVALGVKAGVNADGINIIMNNEAAAEQLIQHAHIHVIPRHEGDGHKGWRGPGFSEKEINQAGEQIRAVLSE